MAAMIATGAIGNWIGEVALLRTSEQRFRLVLQIALTLLGLAPAVGRGRRRRLDLNVAAAAFSAGTVALR